MPEWKFNFKKLRKQTTSHLWTFWNNNWTLNVFKTSNFQDNFKNVTKWKKNTNFITKRWKMKSSHWDTNWSKRKIPWGKSSMKKICCWIITKTLNRNSTTKLAIETDNSTNIINNLYMIWLMRRRITMVEEICIYLRETDW